MTRRTHAPHPPPPDDKPAPGGLAYVQAFVNALDVESGRDAFATPEGLGRWLARYGLMEPDAAVDEADLRRAVDFREAIRAVLLAHNGEALDEEALASLRAIAREVPLRLRYAENGEATLEPAGTGVDAALGALQAAVYDAMRDGTWGRLKACGSDTCRWAFYDASRNRSGTWCSMEVCGNREKVRAHRRRKAGGRA